MLVLGFLFFCAADQHSVVVLDQRLQGRNHTDSSVRTPHAKKILDPVGHNRTAALRPHLRGKVFDDLELRRTFRRKDQLHRKSQVVSPAKNMKRCESINIAHRWTLRLGPNYSVHCATSQHIHTLWNTPAPRSQTIYLLARHS